VARIPLLRQVLVTAAHGYLTLAKLSVLGGSLGRAVGLCIRAYYVLGAGRLDLVPGMLAMPLSSLVRVLQPLPCGVCVCSRAPAGLTLWPPPPSLLDCGWRWLGGAFGRVAALCGATGRLRAAVCCVKKAVAAPCPSVGRTPHARAHTHAHAHKHAHLHAATQCDVLTGPVSAFPFFPVVSAHTVPPPLPLPGPRGRCLGVRLRRQHHCRPWPHLGTRGTAPGGCARWRGGQRAACSACPGVLGGGPAGWGGCGCQPR
jgi:hypothetical protein